MRVRFSDHIFRIEQYGGVSRYITELHRGLLDRGEDSAVVAPLHINAFLHGCERVRGVDIAALRPRSLRQALAKGVDGAWSRIGWSRLGADDIVHLTYFSATAPRRGHLVVTVYDMVHERFPEGIGSRDRTVELKRQNCEAADLVLTISHQTRADLLERYHLRPDRVMVTPLGARACSGVDERRAPRPVPYLLYVGNRGRRYKNFERFVEAVAASEAARALDLVCFGGGSFDAREMTLFSNLGMTRRVAHAQGDDVALARHYKSAVALVYPSLYEGFGLPPLEAMLYDCPVAAASVGAIPEVVGSAALLFDPTDAEAMTAAIDRIVEDTQLRSALCDDGRRRAREYTWERTVDDTLTAYRALLGDTRCRT